MKYEIIKWTIEWHHIGDVIEMNEKLAKAYGEKYLKPIKEKTEAKDLTEIQDKALKPNKKGRKNV